MPTQRAAYAAIQNSLVASASGRNNAAKPDVVAAASDRNSVSAMSGVSSASGGSTLGPLPEDEEAMVGGGLHPAAAAVSPALLRRPRASSLSSPASSPRSPSKQFPGKSRRVSAPPSAQPPDIINMSPPSVRLYWHRIRSILMFLGLPDPDLIVRGTDPDLSLFS